MRASAYISATKDFTVSVTTATSGAEALLLPPLPDAAAPEVCFDTDFSRFVACDLSARDPEHPCYLDSLLLLSLSFLIIRR